MIIPCSYDIIYNSDNDNNNNGNDNEAMQWYVIAQGSAVVTRTTYYY